MKLEKTEFYVIPLYFSDFDDKIESDKIFYYSEGPPPDRRHSFRNAGCTARLFRDDRWHQLPVYDSLEELTQPKAEVPGMILTEYNEKLREKDTP